MKRVSRFVSVSLSAIGLLMVLFLLLTNTPLVLEACCKHIGNVGPTGGGVGLWGFVYLNNTPIENAIVTISKEGESVLGCTYLGEGDECPIGVILIHSVESDPYYGIEIGGLYSGGITGLPLEPITLNISVIYTDTQTSEVYEAMETITLSAADFNEYKEVRLDISLYPAYSNGSGVPVPADFIVLENTTVHDNRLKLVFDGLLQNTQMEQMELNQRDYAFEVQGDSYLAYNPAQQLHLEINSSKFKLSNQTSNEFWAMEMEVEGENLADVSPFLAQANTLSNLSQNCVNQEPWVEYSLTLPSNGSETVVKIALNTAGLMPALVEGTAQLNWQTARGIALQSSWFASNEQGIPVLVKLSLINNGQALLVKLPPTSSNILLSSYWTRGLSLIPDEVLEGEQVWDWFSRSVNSAGDVNGDGYIDLIVGAHRYQVNGVRGKVYVYYGGPNGFPTEPSWTALGNQPGMELFGYSVNGAGDINGDGYADILVSDPLYDHGEMDEGLVLAYFGSANGLGQSNRDPDWAFEGNQPYLELGNTSHERMKNGVGSLGNIGDQQNCEFCDDFFISTEKGQVYVFYGNSQFNNMLPNWSYPDPSDLVEGYLYIQKGGDINGDLYDDVLVAYGPYEPTPNSSYFKIFWGSENGLSDANHQTISLNTYGKISPQTANDINNDGFADVFIPYTTTATIDLYLGSSTGLNTLPDWTYQFQSTPQEDIMGLVGDINGDQLSDLFANRRPPNHYAFTIFHGHSNGLPNVPDFSPITNLGTYVKTSDDINNDGYSDIINGRIAGGTYIGYVEIFYGKPHPIQATATQVLTGTAGQLGGDLKTVEDLTGDNLPDLAISTPHCIDQTAPGQVDIYTIPVDLTSQPTLPLQGNTADECFGQAIIGLDLNQDHHQDFIVSAPEFNNGHGRIYIYQGTENGLNPNPVLTYEGEANSSFGSSLAHAGDLNGDGYADWVVGSPNADKITIFLGNANFANFIQIPLLGPAGSRFGFTVTGGKDVNGDGFSDILVGTPSYTNDQQNEGGVWLYTGSPHTGINVTPIWSAEGNRQSSQYGSAIALADLTGDGLSDVVVGDSTYNLNRGRLLIYNASPVAMSNIPTKVIEGVGGHQLGFKIDSADLNHDGWLDLVISAPNYTNGQAYEGAIYIYHGSSNGLIVSNPLIVESNTVEAYLGQVLAVGDLNSDGFTDLAGGFPTFNNYAGQVQWFSNNGRGGGHIQLRQITTAGQPLPLMGLVNYQDGVGCRLEGSPLIIGDKRELICEFAPISESFGGPHTVTTTLGTFTSQLLPGTTYKWRARWVYGKNNILGQRVSPWFTPAWNGLSEADFQTTVGEDLITNIIAPAEVKVGTPITIVAQSFPITTPLPIQYNWQLSLNNQIPELYTSIAGLTNSIVFTPTETGLLTIQVQTENSDNPPYLATKYVAVTPYLVGTAVTQPITPTVNSGVLRWDMVKLVADVPPNTSIQAYVLDSNQNPINCVSPTHLSDGENYLPISCIDPAVYPTIHIGFTLTTNQYGISPAITNWRVQWLEINSPTHKIAGQAKDGYGNVLVNATATLYISGTVATTTLTNAQGWYTFEQLHNSDTPYTVRVQLANNRFSVHHNKDEVVYLESQPFYLNPAQSIFTTKIVNVNFLENQTHYTTNIPYPERLDDLAVIYHHSYQAVEFIETELQEPGLPTFVVKAFDPTLTTAEYEELSATIYLGVGYSAYNNANRPMNREWHEIFHHLMAHRVGFIPDASVCTPPNPFQNHGGYWNSCTSDSWSEGWAVFWSAVLSDHLNWGTPGIYQMGQDRHLSKINLEIDYKAWAGYCNLEMSGFDCYHREEFAVASTLWDLYDDLNDNRDQVHQPLDELWAILKQSHLHDMKDVYDALVSAGIGQNHSQPDACDLNDLDEIFVAHGFFHDENEDKIHQCSEEVGRAANGMVYPRSDRQATPTIANSIGILSNAPITTPMTVTVEVTFEQFPEWNYNYEALVVDNGMYIEPPTTEYSATITINAYTQNSGESQNPFVFTNNDYWEAFAQSEVGEEVISHSFEIRWFGYIPVVYR